MSNGERVVFDTVHADRGDEAINVRGVDDKSVQFQHNNHPEYSRQLDADELESDAFACSSELPDSGTLELLLRSGADANARDADAPGGQGAARVC